jgi:hypothetical protein
MLESRLVFAPFQPVAIFDAVRLYGGSKHSPTFWAAILGFGVNRVGST